MTTELAFLNYAFLNTPLIIFCLMYSLYIPHNNQNASFFSGYPSFQNSYFGDISLHRNDHSHRKIIVTFFYSCDFTIVTADVIAYYIVCYRFQALKLNLVEYLRFTNCYGKANKKRISWHSET